MTPLDHALAYAQRGWRVAPIAPGTKYPRLDRWQITASAHPAMIRERFTPTDGVSIVTGIESGIFVLDVDPAHGGDDTLADLEHEHGALPDTVEAITGGGGRHLYFTMPDGLTIVNNAGTALGPGLDIRGEGGQVVAPPTIHPNGQPYTWETEHDPLDGYKVADAPTWLLDMLTKASAPVEPRRERTKPAKPSMDPEPGDWYAERHTWPELLEPDGWRLFSRRTDHRTGTAYELWTRPGKEVSDGASASLYYGGSDVLKVFTSNPPPGLTEGTTYTKFGYYAATRHGSSFGAAASAIRTEMMMKAGEWFTPAEGCAVGVEQIARPQPLSDPMVWPELQPLGAGVGPLPPFPVHVLPGWIGEHVEQVARELQVAVDLPACLALVALSTAAAKRAEVFPRTYWREQLCLYVVVALPPGEGKSPAFSQMLSPLEELERKLIAEAAPRIEEQTTKRAVLEKAKKMAIEKGDTAEALHVGDEIRLLNVEAEPRLFVDDVTVEKLGEMMRDQGGRLALVSTEGGLFDQMIGRYSEKVKASLDPYLQMWSGDTVRVDRVGRGSTVIDKPALTIGVTVQPSVLSALADRPELKGKGLTARFMYALPPSAVGRRNMRSDSAIDANVRERYGRNIVGLYERLAGRPTPQAIGLTPAARALYDDWRQSIEDRIGDTGDLHDLAEWSIKVQSTAARVAGLLHLADTDTAGDELAAETMARAITVGNYWIEHARAVHDLWGSDKTAAAARKVADWLAAHRIEEFSVRDCLNANRSVFPRVTDTVDPLGHLVDCGYLRPLFDGPLVVDRPGKPSPRFAVNPATLSDQPAYMRVMRLEIQKRYLSLSSAEHENKRPPTHDTHETQVANSTLAVDNPPSDDLVETGGF